jgi:signal transduction histidine kinase
MPGTLRSGIAITATVLVAAAAAEALLIAFLVRSEGLSTTTTTLVAFAMAALAVIAAGAVYVLRRPADAIESVTLALRALESGDLSHRMRPATAGDSHALTDAFNRTADTVVEIIDDLKVERNKLAAVLETMADGVVLVNSDDHVTLINRAARYMFVLAPGPSTTVIDEDRLRDHELQQMVKTCRRTGERQHK